MKRHKGKEAHGERTNGKETQDEEIAFDRVTHSEKIERPRDQET